MIYISLIICFVVSVLITPIIKKFAFKIGAVDKPNNRKVHSKLMPRIGGLGIFMSFLVGFLLLRPENQYSIPILIGSFIIVITGIIDDIYEISPKFKLLGQVLAASIVIYHGLDVEFINLPFGGQIEFGIFTIPITLLWIVGITNAINLIDGLDGLAAGVSSIAIITIFVMAIIMGDFFVAGMCLILLGSTLGFLVYNFYPAKIFMGDTGALFLGYMIAVLSLLGFKNVTFISFIVPIIILGVPISDTFFAIIRRIVRKKPLSSPDKSHLHHCLLNLGFGHRETVLIIYTMSAIFGGVAIIFSQATMWVSLIVISILLIAIELVVEITGLIGSNYKPILKLFREIKVENMKNR
ncbi:MAG: undecaprenyl-phosphate alpha-N-acetylglucosaminyl 1-phosphate transferase [Bacillaceae bacterium]|jgi:UDP-GlcNAc:undecaprenyl-phosphate/decaprenyl-phosphate GlcNAc-1-phosphate transferase|uniref:MraY family glycosyltransferase n=1 Tax=Aeribacillus composti TaxID=1868734 RepID=A0ABY9WEJ0_9BACI|nr:MraY family glycosyltransferase [Aeribacillus composti]REJ20901.1 MAG: undecaprenyl-phosphate alpha-N-acetylglucosaminyl 1-phosphate transferase [Bacillaceae bacterium]TVZ85819.1 UDP-GlcNAc:undecaprenyl-phosphate GlcNAc-1-phosphate transferase [Aeribacillus composti]WNF33622.1 MraY family glycosyltransferase [Aeribacillus composti]BBU38268.1 undecaprenyl-phosphate alpha-N-acetylglucosaminyl 1-phosphate transferase [Aeribacillus pallidus]